MYDHKSIQISEVVKSYHEILQPFDDKNGIEPSALNESLVACDKYILAYGKRYSKTEVYREAIAYYEDVVSVESREEDHAMTKDTVKLKIALLAARQINKVSSLFNYSSGEITMEADMLERLGKQEEAKRSLTQIFKVIDEGARKKEVAGRLKEIDVKIKSGTK